MKIEMVDPADYSPHPRNFRVHPVAQSAAIEKSLHDHGFYKPILVNQKTMRVLNGHERRDVWMDTHPKGTKVPAVVIDVSVQSELEILLQFDKIGSMRDFDSMAVLGVLEQLVESAEGLPAGYTELMLESLRGDHENAAEIITVPSVIPVPVRLRMSGEQHAMYLHMIASLMAKWGTTGASDTVARAIRTCHGKMF